MSDKKEEVNPFTPFWWRINLKDSDLEKNAYLLGITISISINYWDDAAFPSIATLCKESRLSKASVCRALNELEEAGWIVRSRTKQRGVNKYRLRYPNGMSFVRHMRAHDPSHEVVSQEEQVVSQEDTIYNHRYNTTSLKEDANASSKSDMNSSPCDGQLSDHGTELSDNKLPPQLSLPDFFPPIPKSLPPDVVARLEAAFDQMWPIFPPKRRGTRKQAAKALVKALHQKRGTLEEIYLGIRAYSQSEEVRKDGGRYVKGFAAWLNDDRWTHQYETISQPQGGKTHDYKQAGIDLAKQYLGIDQTETGGVDLSTGP